ncbi:MAG: flagellar motor switch protein FliM [Oscillospiraceae bacterium]|nr:flagellar motor switch protein FliM [Oscillospiraceae bacterium]
MADVLTQEQIDAMLSNASAGEPIVAEVEKAPEVKEYDFRSPKKFTKERIKTLDSIFDNYSRLLSSYLTGLLRLYCKVSLVSVEEQKYFEFNNALPDYVMMGMAELKIQDDEVEDLNLIVQLSNTLTYIMIDRLLGGKGEHLDTGEREFTEIEVSIMENLIRNFLGLMKEPWASYVELEPVLENMETNARVISAMGHDDTMIIVMLEIMVIETKALITICMPAIGLEGIMQKYTTRQTRTGRKIDASREKERKTNILDGVTHTALDIKAVLGEVDLDMLDVLRLQQGDIIPLGKNIDSNIVLNVGGKKWFDGKMGVFNNKKAVKIENIFSMEI